MGTLDNVLRQYTEESKRTGVPEATLYAQDQVKKGEQNLELDMFKLSVPTPRSLSEQIYAFQQQIDALQAQVTGLKALLNITQELPADLLEAQLEGQKDLDKIADSQEQLVGVRAVLGLDGELPSDVLEAQLEGKQVNLSKIADSQEQLVGLRAALGLDGELPSDVLEAQMSGKQVDLSKIADSQEKIDGIKAFLGVEELPADLLEAQLEGNQVADTKRYQFTPSDIADIGVSSLDEALDFLVFNRAKKGGQVSSESLGEAAAEYSQEQVQAIIDRLDLIVARLNAMNS